MSLHALPQDLCAHVHRHAPRQVPRPPRLAGTKGTGSKTRLSGFSGISGLSGLLAVAQRHIKQKRRLLHWRHAHQLSLCISDADFSHKLQRLAAHRRVQHAAGTTADASKPSKAHLLDLMIQLVAARAELNQQGDPLGVLTINADLLYLARYIHRTNSPPASRE